MVGVENAARLGDVDRLPRFDRPRELGQPFEVGASHRVLARRLRHPVEPGKLPLYMLLDLGRHFRLGDLLRQLGDFLSLGVLTLAEFLLDRPHLLAQQEFALAIVDLALGLLADLPRQLQNLDAVGQQFRYALEPALDIDRLQDLLFFLRRDVHEARNQIGERRGRGHRLHGIDELGRGLRQQLQHLERLVAQIEEPRGDIRCRRLGLLDPLDPGGEKRVAVEKIENAKTPLALADRVVTAVRAGDITQQARFGAHAMQIDRDRIVDAGVALQHQPDGPVEPHRRLRRQHRALPAERDRQHRAGEQNKVAGRNKDQRVLRQCRDGGRSHFDTTGGGGAALPEVRSSRSSKGMADILKTCAAAASGSHWRDAGRRFRVAPAATRSVAENARAGSPAGESGHFSIRRVADVRR